MAPVLVEMARVEATVKSNLNLASALHYIGFPLLKEYRIHS